MIGEQRLTVDVIAISTTATGTLLLILYCRGQSGLMSLNQKNKIGGASCSSIVGFATRELHYPSGKLCAMFACHLLVVPVKCQLFLFPLFCSIACS